jgi:hypothetical protein
MIDKPPLRIIVSEVILTDRGPESEYIKQEEEEAVEEKELGEAEENSKGDLIHILVIAKNNYKYRRINNNIIYTYIFFYIILFIYFFKKFLCELPEDGDNAETRRS